jgi:hypothetical protein
MSKLCLTGSHDKRFETFKQQEPASNQRLERLKKRPLIRAVVSQRKDHG